MAAQSAATGYKNHLKAIWAAFDLGDRPGPLPDLIETLLRTDDEQGRLDGLARVEEMLPPLVRQVLDQCEEEHRHYTLAMARPGVTERQMVVYQEEGNRLDDRMAALERLLTPYREQVELLAREYQEKLDQLEEAKRVLAEGSNRAKAAVLAGSHHWILVWPRVEDTRRILFLPWWNDPGNETPEVVKNAMIGAAAGLPYPYRRESPEDGGGDPDARAASSASSSALRNRWPSGCLPFWVHGSPRMWYPPWSQLSQNPGRSSVMNSTPRTHFALFHAYSRGTTSRSG